MQYSDKFIAFVDIIGFESLVRASENDPDPAATQRIIELQKALHAKDMMCDFQKHGPTLCPGAPDLQKSLDFQVSQVSDCLVVSAEASPAGLINLLNHCWMAVFGVLRMGHMCRGYVKRGKIIHDAERFVGSGYMDAYSREKLVSVFKRDDDDVGTPFVEIDPEVVRYVETCGDKCVPTMFKRLTKTDGSMTALFPFSGLGHSFLIGAPGYWFDAEKERQSVNVVRQWIHGLRQNIEKYVDPSNRKAVRKGEHYLNALDERMKHCDFTETSINKLGGPIGSTNPSRWKAWPRTPRT
jgi:hypothetical protein